MLRSTRLSSCLRFIQYSSRRYINTKSIPTDFTEEAKHFENTVLRRSAVRHFNDKTIPHEILSHILALTQRTPSGYNLQPWAAVVVNDEIKKQQLHEAALSQKKILTAPITVVFAANHHVLENLEQVIGMEVESGHWDKKYAERTDLLARTLLQTGPCYSLQVIKYITTTALSYFKPIMQAPLNIKAYTWKSTMMAASTFMLAAASHGLATHPMEGFDERRVKEVVGLPSHFSVPVIISLGYSDDVSLVRSTRLPPEQVYSANSYEIAMENIQSFNPPIRSTNSTNTTTIEQPGATPVVN
jgi:nitroreductase